MPRRAPAPQPLESTAVLLERARAGERGAREQLARRYLPPLRAFAHGRLPRGARGLEETDDLVQIALVRGFAQIERFQAEHRGSFLVYLRVILDNLIRDRWRAERQRPLQVPLPDDLPHHRTPLDEVIAGEDQARYERALAGLKPVPRDALLLRFELDLGYPEIAVELGLPSANAARMRVERALLRLGQLMRRDRGARDGAPRRR